jgi:hypothetical protein
MCIWLHYCIQIFWLDPLSSVQGLVLPATTLANMIPDRCQRKDLSFPPFFAPKPTIEFHNYVHNTPSYCSIVAEENIIIHSGVIIHTVGILINTFS